MNKDQIQGKWNVLKGKFREKWAKLTDDELDRFAGQREELVGRIQKLYGDSRETIENELDRIERSIEGAKPGAG